MTNFVTALLITAAFATQSGHGPNHLLYARASWMGHHIGQWITRANTLVVQDGTSREWFNFAVSVSLFFLRICPCGSVASISWVDLVSLFGEIVRTIEEMGIPCINLNPDPAAVTGKIKSLGDRFFYPITKKMWWIRHSCKWSTVSAACNDCFHTTGCIMLGCRYDWLQALMMSDVFKDFPDTENLVPHGGRAVPYHWTFPRSYGARPRFWSGLSALLNNVYFWLPVVYHSRRVLIWLLDTIFQRKNILFASETWFVALRGIDSRNGSSILIDYETLHRPTTRCWRIAEAKTSHRIEGQRGVVRLFTIKHKASRFKSEEKRIMRNNCSSTKYRTCRQRARSIACLARSRAVATHSMGISKGRVGFACGHYLRTRIKWTKTIGRFPQITIQAPLATIGWLRPPNVATRAM